MDLQTAPSPDALSGDAQAYPAGTDWRRPLLERQLWIATQLVEDTFAASQVLTRRITAPEPAPECSADAPASQRDPIFQGDLGLAHHRAQRAVRLAIALQTKLIDLLCKHDSDAKVDAEIDALFATRAPKPSKPASFVDPRMARAQTIVEGVIEGEHDDPKTVDGLIDATCARIRDADNFGPILARPMSEIVAYLCGEAGLSPDWPRLAKQAWARDEVRSGKVGAPLKDSLSLDGRGAGVRVTAEPAPPKPTPPEPSRHPHPQPFPPPPTDREAPPPPPDPTPGLPGELPPRRRPPPPPRAGEFIIGAVSTTGPPTPRP